MRCQTGAARRPLESGLRVWGGGAAWMVSGWRQRVLCTCASLLCASARAIAPHASAAHLAAPDAIAGSVRAREARLDPHATPLDLWPLLMAHDAATTYIAANATGDVEGEREGKGVGLSPVVRRWSVTQPAGGMARLLGCGARAFDWRPALDAHTGGLHMHHGGVSIPKSMGEALDEMVEWAARSSSPRVTAAESAADAFIVLAITDCDGGDACVAEAKRLLGQRNISYVTSDACDELRGVTVAEAVERAALPGGGAVLALFDCWEMHYDSSIACSGFDGSADANAQASSAATGAWHYACYVDSPTRGYPLERMWAYQNETVAGGPPGDGRLWATQILWQESPDSVALGELAGSSLLLDEHRSRLNALTVARVVSGDLDVSSGVSLVEINDVCDNGAALIAAIRGAVARAA